jgi:hypothetical protein
MNVVANPLQEVVGKEEEEAAVSSKAQENEALVGRFVEELAKGNLGVIDELLAPTSSIAARLPDEVRPMFCGTLAERLVADQLLDVLIAGDDEESEETVARLARDGVLRDTDVGPLERARQLEGLGFLGITLQQPLVLNFQRAWKLLS